MNRQHQIQFIGRIFLLVNFLVVFLNIKGLSEAADIKGNVQILDERGNLKNDRSGVIIFLDSIENYSYGQVSHEKASIQQVDKRFDPQVLPIMIGTEVAFPNNDYVFHNVFSLSKKKSFDLGIYKQGDSRSVVFDHPGLVKVYCNIHPEMVAYILITDNPFYTLTDKDGNFVLKDVPSEKMTVRSWYPHAKKQHEQQIQVTEQGIQDLNLVLLEQLILEIREETISIKHKNKWGQDYPSKY